ncbi:alpha-N-acetylglucosaminidase [Ostrinia furnacalis]|uniref:alpha-N-acetylglucosaminidase n=1 Tax=Ostrinia furnacalis TaxID=93504 RepID=UPI00103A97A5|nr:alpha-N-acetylglucosaminidase [Ostrinia furnacalis]
MELYFLLFLAGTAVNALNLDYLDPVKLQTKASPAIQERIVLGVLSKYIKNVNVEINPLLFSDHKDTVSLRTSEGQLCIRASSGTAAMWGFNHYLKKYCNSQIAWQVQRVSIPSPLPEVNETIVASDRFRYYQNVCTVSYSFVWWDMRDWRRHVEWMAFNGINLALAPIAQEAAWAKIYRQLGMSQEEIDQHFTGPAFLSWLRMGNVRGWGGPLGQAWHDRQRRIQGQVSDYMLQFGIVPVFPSFNGHVPVAFRRLYPNATFHSVTPWNKFREEYCCGLFLDPSEENLFEQVGGMFMREITSKSVSGSIYTADPFNEIRLIEWNDNFVQNTARRIFSVMTSYDKDAVWLVQNWMFVHDPILWPKSRVKSFLTSVPNGRMLVLDLQSEQWPQYFLYEMYFGQPFIWCMLHNFGGTLGMFGSIPSINRDVYAVRNRVNSTMLGIGLTPEGINQNYVVYDFMLETGWRKDPVEDLNQWVTDYAARRYGCYNATKAWKSLLKSVYSFDGLNRMRGKYVVTKRPSLRLKPWAWYKSKDLFDAFREFVFIEDSNCFSPGFYHDLVDVTRQALQYRAEQLYINMVDNLSYNTWSFNSSIIEFLDVMNDMETILASNEDFKIGNWLRNARAVGKTHREKYIYELNARNQITLWGPNGEISDYACKQWAEVFHYYYRPRWAKFLSAALDAAIKKETIHEPTIQRIIKTTVEEQFQYIEIDNLPQPDTRDTALNLYTKWAYVPELLDLPLAAITPKNRRRTTLADIVEDDDVVNEQPTVTMIFPTTPV